MKHKIKKKNNTTKKAFYDVKDIACTRVKSKKQKMIDSIQHSFLCKRCKEIIMWKKKTRKYKMLKQSRKCNSCSEKSVHRPYHTICDGCARHLHCCAKCKNIETKPTKENQFNFEQFRKETKLKAIK